MPRIKVRSLAALVATLAILASCARAPATAHVQGPADPCRKYESPTDFGRCRLFTSADGWQFIPEIGRHADLDKQIRCAPVRPDLDVYADCIRRNTRSLAAAAVPTAPVAAPASRAPIRVEPLTRDVAADEFEQMLRELEQLDPALRAWTPPRVEPTAPAEATVAGTIPRAPSSWTAPRVEPSAPVTVARSVPKSPAVAEPKQSFYPRCAENGSCYGDISSYTGRPKTVHVRGYFRKDGTYVRSHYRSRPRR